MTNSKYSNDDLMTIVTRLVASLASSGDNFMKPENISKELKQDYVNSHMNLLVEAYNAGIDAAIEALPDTKGKDARYQVGVADCALNILKLKKG